MVSGKHKTTSSVAWGQGRTHNRYSSPQVRCMKSVLDALSRDPVTIRLFKVPTKLNCGVKPSTPCHKSVLCVSCIPQTTLILSPLYIPSVQVQLPQSADDTLVNVKLCRNLTFGLTSQKVAKSTLPFILSQMASLRHYF